MTACVNAKFLMRLCSVEGEEERRLQGHVQHGGVSIQMSVGSASRIPLFPAKKIVGRRTVTHKIASAILKSSLENP